MSWFHRNRIAKWDESQHPRDEKGRFAAGDTVRFSGTSADGRATGDMDVLVVNPHSNLSKVTSRDSRGAMYEGASRHLPTATVMGLHSGNTFEAHHHTLKPAAEGAEVYAPRQEGETDKQYAKRVVDQMPAPKSLPEKHDRYFIVTPDTKIVDIDSLESSKTDEENVKGGGNGAKRLRAAFLGLLSKREPITVTPIGNGRFKILDGNGTYTALKRYGWKQMPVQVDDPDKVNPEDAAAHTRWEQEQERRAKLGLPPMG